MGAPTRPGYAPRSTAIGGRPWHGGGVVPRLPAASICALVVLVLALSACTSGENPSASPSPSSSPPTTSPTASPTASAPEPAPVSAGPDAAAVFETVRELADLGPREATSPQFLAAVQIVSDRLAALGYEVTEQEFRVPAGESWGVAVGAGRTRNVVARLPGASPDGAASVVVGAHLDTVPQAPGAEDNASGVGVVLELARLAAGSGTARPVTFVLFGAEEPRGPGDDEHHFGSQEYVRRIEAGTELPPVAMVSLDRVGTGGTVPVCTGGLSPRRVQRELMAAAERLGVPARACENRTSDHWPFEKAGETVARLGGNDYAAYHSAYDLPRVLSRRQLDRVARVMWEWLQSG